MPVKLWHFTTADRAESIRKEGFRKGPRPDFPECYFSREGNRDHDAYGDTLVEVTLGVTEAEIAPYDREVMYKIPADFINNHTLKGYRYFLK